MIQPRRIYDTDLSLSAKAIFCYLCNRSNALGQSFPSVERISKDLSVSRSMVYRSLDRLEEKGFITRERRYTPDGALLTTLYTIKGEITKGGGG